MKTKKKKKKLKKKNYKKKLRCSIRVYNVCIVTLFFVVSCFARVLRLISFAFNIPTKKENEDDGGRVIR